MATALTGQLAGLAGVSGMGNQANAQTDAARARQADAIGSLYNAGAQQRANVLNGTQQIADAYAARLQPYNTLLGVGARNEDLYARTLADRVRVNAAKQSAVTAPLDYLAQLANMFQGGTTVRNGTQPEEIAAIERHQRRVERLRDDRQSMIRRNPPSG